MRGSAYRLALASAAGLSCLVALSLAPAEAQVITSVNNRQQSPQHFALEFRFGPYRPDVDSEFSGTGHTPYKDFFGSGRHLMMQVELDYQLIRHVGSLAVGASLGYFKQTGNDLYADGSARQSADTSSFRLLPFALSAVYRFDLAYERFGIPVVPYGKLGLDYIFWTINNGNDEVPTAAGGRGQGGTLGWHAAVGLSLVLDFLDQNSANQFDEEMGVNHTHLFFEYGHIDASGLGQSSRLHVGDTTWTAGLMFEF
ncbi:MAG TPA: MXAN_2562 family outer membrane beta-barrel protein [Polyangia bacterium]